MRKSQCDEEKMLVRVLGLTVKNYLILALEFSDGHHLIQHRIQICIINIISPPKNVFIELSNVLRLLHA